MNELIDYLNSQDVEYKRNVKLSQYSAISIGGVADIVIFPDTKEVFTDLLKRVSACGKPFKIVGNMSNLLMPDGRCDTVLISTRRLRAIIFFEEGARAECGALFSAFITKAAENSLGGYEKLFAIPGTVGAMLAMNAGAYGISASDFVSKIEIFDFRTQDVKTFDKNEIKFDYRTSSLRDEGVAVIEATFSLPKNSKENIYASISQTRQKRIDSQPIYAKSLGSVFKRDKDYAASYLIDRAGLKGAHVGGISVSDKHAGFFVNDGTGTAAQFKELAELVKNEVLSKFGVELSLEVEYVE